VAVDAECNQVYLRIIAGLTSKCSVVNSRFDMELQL
jgi:hypothetical protein